MEDNRICKFLDGDIVRIIDPGSELHGKRGEYVGRDDNKNTNPEWNCGVEIYGYGLHWYGEDELELVERSRFFPHISPEATNFTADIYEGHAWNT